MVFVDYRKLSIILNEESQNKIKERHSEITLNQIKMTLLDPIEVRKSTHKNSSELYYSYALNSGRFICVVVKMKTSDSRNYIETAYTSSKIKTGEVIFTKENK